MFDDRMSGGFLEPLRPASLDVSDDALSFDVCRFGALAAAAECPPHTQQRRPKAAAPGITALHTSHPSEWLVSGGVDGLEATIYGAFNPEYTAREAQFEELREAAAAGRRECCLEVQGGALFFQGRGHRWGAGFMSWVCECDGIRLSLAKSSQSAKCPVAKVQISSLKLMLDGAESSWQHALRLLKALGVVVYSNVLYRIDACLDMPGVDVGHFCEAVSDGEVISRIKSQASFNKSCDGSWQGCAIGSRKGVRIVFYDKVQELRDAGGIEAEAKREVLIQRRWGLLPERATRVEFQIRGDYLRQRYEGLRSVEDVLARLGDVVAHLSTQFFRIVDGPVDREHNHQSRADISPAWSRVIEGFCEWACGEAAPMIRLEKKAADRETQVKRLVQSAISVAAMSPKYCASRETIIQRVIDELVRSLPDERELFERIWKKHDAWESRGVYGVLTFDDLEPGHWAMQSFRGWDHERKEWSAFAAMVRGEVGFDLD